MIDKNKFFSELDAMVAVKSTAIREHLALHAFRKKKLLLVLEWLHQKPEQDFRTTVYHALNTQKVVPLSEAAILYLKGWTDGSPSKGIRGKWYAIVIFFRTTLKPFWINHWKWIIGIVINLILGIIGICIAWLQLKAPK